MLHPDPSHPLSIPERLIFGADAKRHRILGFVLEQGSGCLSEAEQAALYVREIEKEHGTEAADAMRRKLKGETLPVATRPMIAVVMPPQV